MKLETIRSIHNSPSCMGRQSPIEEKARIERIFEEIGESDLNHASQNKQSDESENKSWHFNGGNSRVDKEACSSFTMVLWLSN